MANIISNDVRVSPIEYVTKYSINRNFLRLIKNDESLQADIESKLNKDQVHSYIPKRKYSKDECVFFKTDVESLNLYLLCSEIDDNTNVPYTYINSIGESVVSSDCNWKIVGLPAGTNVNPKDHASEYILSSKNKFIIEHQDNQNLSAHPTGKLGINESTVAFTSFENISNERKTFFYPNQLASLNADDSIIAGYMRKWDNGLLEYDIIFRVGYFGNTDENGTMILSANVLDVYHRNMNNLYFKDDRDFSIFKQGNDHYVTVNGTKQVNLNTSLNSYHGEIKFPEPFKDLNYMIFTSNVKNIDTESLNLKDEPIKGTYDSRLIVEGLTIVGYQVSAEWEKELRLPKEILNIGNQALSWIKEVNDMEVKITMLSDDELINIEDYAFDCTDIRQITIPKNVRCIGAYAFNYCTNLQTVDFYVNSVKSKQPIIDFNVFNGCENLYEINIHYYSDPPLFAVSKESRSKVYSNEMDIAEKFEDPDIRTLYKLPKNIIINTYDRPEQNSDKMSFLATNNSNSSMNDRNEDGNQNFMQISIDDFIAELNREKTINVVQANYNNDCIFVTCTENSICSFDSIDLVEITGNDISVQLSGKYIENLKVKDVKSINFISSNIDHIDNFILTNESNDETIYKAYSFANLNVDNFNIDLNNSFIESSAFIGSRIGTLNIENFDLAYIKPIINRKGIGIDSFLCCKIENVNIKSDKTKDEIKNELSSIFINNENCNIPSFPDNCQINDNMMHVQSGAISIRPESNYLCIEDVGGKWSVVSCRWNEILAKLSGEFEDIDIVVPTGVQCIGLSAFNREISKQLADHIPIKQITFPNTIESIDNYAFAKLEHLNNLNFNVPNLKSLGIGIIKGCKSLLSFDLK